MVIFESLFSLMDSQVDAGDRRQIISTLGVDFGRSRRLFGRKDIVQRSRIALKGPENSKKPSFHLAYLFDCK